MVTLLYYSAIGGFVLLVLYIVYRLAMASENQHGFNRGILLGIYGVSFALFPVFDLLKSVSSSKTDNIIVISAHAVPKGVDIFLIPRILLWIYCCGVVLMFLVTIYNYLRLINIIRKGRRVRNGCYTIVVTEDESIAPFSWMRYIVLPEKDYINKGEVIVCHECQHLRLGHWIDLLVAQIAVILNWFNPAAWIMREELKTVHEYQADMGVIASGADMKSYQMLLISKAVGKKFPGLANSLNHSKLKKRINMMLMPRRGSAASKMRALLMIPATALVCVIVSIPVVGSTLFYLQNASFVKKELPASGEVGNTNLTDQDEAKRGENPIIYLNGKKIDEADVNKINPKDINVINVRKDNGGPGIIDIQTK